MRLIHVVIDFWSPGRLGGGARYPDELVKAIDRLGEVDQEVLHARSGGVSTPMGPNIRLLGEHRRQVNEDVAVLAHNPDSAAFDWAVALTAGTGAQLCTLDLGGTTPSLGRLLRKVKYRLVDHCFGISQYALNLSHAPLSRQTVIYGGGDHILRAEAAPALGHVDYTFIGRAVRHKGLRLLLEALRPSESVRVIGPAYPWKSEHGQELQDLLRGIECDLIFDADDGLVRSALTSTSAVVMPTLRTVGGRQLRRPELLGLSALEAAALGTPTVVSDAGALPEVAPMIGAVQFAAGDRLALRTALDTVKGAGHAAASSLPPEMTWNAVARKLIAALVR